MSAAAGAAAAANPYLSAVSGIMSGLTGLGQSAPMAGYGGTLKGGDISVGGLNVPARKAGESVPVSGPSKPPVNMAAMGLIGAGMLVVYLVAK